MNGPNPYQNESDLEALLHISRTDELIGSIPIGCTPTGPSNQSTEIGHLSELNFKWVSPAISFWVG